MTQTGPTVLLIPLQHHPPGVVHAPTAGLAGYGQLLGGPVVPYYPCTSWRLYVTVDADTAGVNTRAMRLAQWGDPTWTRLLHGPALITGAGLTPGLDTHVPPPVIHYIQRH